MLNYIIWNPDPVILRIGSFELLWYGVLFAAGLLLAGRYIWLRFQQEGIDAKTYEALIVYLFAGMFVGARLCHCLFYQPGYFLSHPVEMFLPVMRDDHGGWYFSGYHGLASHGAAAGMLLALCLFKAVRRRPVLSILDYLAIAVPLGGAFIRLGNLVNSEIVGSPSSAPWAFVFPEVDLVPRHPAQLYEALFYLALFLVMAWIFWRCAYRRVRRGFYLSVVMIVIPLFRIFVEMFKEVQEPFEAEMALNMGQWLSVPFVLAGACMLAITQRRAREDA